MSKRNTTIEINGRIYDAHSGALLAGHEPAKAAAHAAAPKAAAKRPTMSDVVRHPAAPARPHAPKHAQTLMRHAVPKPAGTKVSIKAVAPAGSALGPALAEVSLNKSISAVDPKRLHKAKHVPRSHLISHFSEAGAPAVLPAYVPPAPAEALRPLPSRPATAPPKAGRHPKSTADILETALHSASGHEHKPAAKSRRKRGHALAITAAVVAMAGLAGGSQLPALKLHLASAKAGFSAAMPGYRAAGFSLAGLNAGPGVVESRFRSNSDQRAYSLTQKQSGWTSAELRDNFVKSLDPNYQTADAGGNTVYLYGDGNASWVNGGVWYVAQSHGALSNRQLLELASSL